MSGGNDWIETVTGIGMFGLAIGGIVWSHGRHAQKIETAQTDITSLQGRVTALEQMKVAVEGLTRSVEHLSERMVDSQKLAASELARVADSMVAGHKLMDIQLAGFREVTASRLDEVTDSVRAIRAGQERSSPPAGGSGRRPRGAANAA